MVPKQARFLFFVLRWVFYDLPSQIQYKKDKSF